MKKILISLLALSFVLSPLKAYAAEKTVTSETEYLGDGIYVTTTIIESEYSLLATNTKSGSKAREYTNSSGTVIFSLTVSGTFSYTGSSSKCTSASADSTIYSSNWKCTSKVPSMSENKAIAEGTFKQYSSNIVTKTIDQTVTLTCSSTGVLS